MVAALEPGAERLGPRQLLKKYNLWKSTVTGVDTEHVSKKPKRKRSSPMWPGTSKAGKSKTGAKRKPAITQQPLPSAVASESSGESMSDDGSHDDSNESQSYVAPPEPPLARPTKDSVKRPRHAPTPITRQQTQSQPQRSVPITPIATSEFGMNFVFIVFLLTPC